MRSDICSVFLNRSCPRGCPQCGISKFQDMGHMSTEEWMKAFQIMRDKMGVKFFLILGTEPLMMGKELVKLVEFWKSEEIFYALYSTSPQPLFDHWKFPLLKAGISNWSCGIDNLPEDPFAPHITKMKSVSGMEGLKWMHAAGVQVHTTLTISAKNLHNADEVAVWCQKTLPGSTTAINLVEWAHDPTFDFFSSPEKMHDYMIPAWRLPELLDLITRLRRLIVEPGFHVQITDRWLDQMPCYYDRLDYRCAGITGMGIDCDGSLRRCGYCKGGDISKYKVFDLITKMDEIMEIWETEEYNCEGCYWNLTHMLQESFRGVVQKSEFFTRRWRQGP